MGLSSIVNVQISRQTAAVSQAGFGTGMILSSDAAALFGGDTVRSYSDLDGVSADGFTAGMDTYKAAVKYFGQNPKPSVLKIAKGLAKVAQVDTITPTAVNLHDYKVSLSGRKNGVPYAIDYDYTADSSALVTEIVTGLIALINAGTTTHGVVASGTTTLILTANAAGVSFTTSINADPNMALVHTTPVVSVVEMLNAIALVDSDWYALMSTYRSADDVLAIAGYIEAQLKVFGVSSSSASLYDGSSVTDIAYLVKSASYFRTFVEYSSDAANYPEAGLFGRCLPLTPGTETWAFKTIAGQVVDSLTDTQINALKAKNCNYYISVAGVSITLDGKVAGGEYIDVIRLIDLLGARMQEGIFGLFVRLDKLPMTNGGISSVENVCFSVLKANQKLGGVAPDDVDANGDVIPGFSTSFPKVSDLSPNDRAARTLNGGSWTARISGAIHAVNINGTVTV